MILYPKLDRGSEQLDLDRGNVDARRNGNGVRRGNRETRRSLLRQRHRPPSRLRVAGGPYRELLSRPGRSAGSRRRRSQGTGTSRYVGGVAALCRSEEHTSELQSLMRISYAVFCLKKKTKYKIRE